MRRLVPVLLLMIGACQGAAGGGPPAGLAPGAGGSAAGGEGGEEAGAGAGGEIAAAGGDGGAPAVGSGGDGGSGGEGGEAVEVCSGADDDADGEVDEGLERTRCGSCAPCEEVRVKPFAVCAEREWAGCESIVPEAFDEDAIEIAYCSRGCFEGSPQVLAIHPGTDEARLVNAWNGSRFRTPAITGPRRTIDRANWILGAAGVQQLAWDGQPGCAARVDGALDIAADPAGRLWVLTDRASLVAVYPASWRPAPGEPCVVIDLAPADPASVELALPRPATRIAAGLNGILWTSSNPAARIDTDTRELQEVPHLAAGPVAVTWNGDAWFGGEQLHRVSGVGPYLDRAEYEEILDVPGGDVRGGSDDVWVLAEDGTLWWAGPTGRAHDVVTFPLPLPREIPSPTSFGVSWYQAWIAAGDTAAVAYPPFEDRFEWTVVRPEPGLEISVDSTYFGLGDNYLRGRWQQVLDAGEGRRWAGVGWSRPEHWYRDGTIDVLVRLADHEEDLPLASWCRIESGDANLLACAGPRRHVEILLRLHRDRFVNEGGPVVDRLWLQREG